MKESVQFDIPPRQAYGFLFKRYSKYHRYKLESFTEPSMFVVKTGSPVFWKYATPGCLIKVMIEQKGEGTEVSFSFDFGRYAASFWIFELMIAGFILTEVVKRLLSHQSISDVALACLLFLIPIVAAWVMRYEIRDVKARFIADSRATIRKGMKYQKSETQT